MSPRTRLIASVLCVSLAGIACKDEPAAPATQNDSSTQTVPSIEFDADFGEPAPSSKLVGGGSAHVVYDAQRFWDVYNGQADYGWFASAFHCYGYGCCEVTFPQVDAHYRFDTGETETRDLSSGEMTIELPEDASSLQMWFEAPGFEIRTWYCGCSGDCAQENYEKAQPHWYELTGWDSDYGKNYHFPVEGTAFDVVHGEDVKLVSAETAYGPCSSCGRFFGEIEVRNIDYHKSVQVAYTVIGGGSTDDGAWHAVDAEFLGMSSGGEFERWGFETTGAPFLFGETRFAVRYDVDGQTHWDNNCGWNYQLEGAGDTATGHSCHP